MKTTSLAKILSKLSKEMDIQFKALFSLSGAFSIENSANVFNPDNYDPSEVLGIDNEGYILLQDSYFHKTRSPFDSFMVDDKIEILIEMEDYLKNKNV